MVCSVNHDEELQHLLLSNTRIISTAHKSIASLFHNHIDSAVYVIMNFNTDHQLNPLIIAFRDFLEDAIQTRVSMAHTHIPPASPPVSALREFLSESWCSDASKTTQRAAQFLFTHVPETVTTDSAKRTISACLCRCGQSITRKETSVVSAEQYTKLRKQHDDLIFSPLDKNMG